jgi:hypothetical protein
MGASISQQAKQTLSLYTDVVNSVVNNVYSEASQRCAGANYFKVNIGGGPDCNFIADNVTVIIRQKVETNCTFESEQVTQLDTEFRTQLDQQTRQFIDQQASNRSGWLAIFFSIVGQQGEQRQEITNRIVNSITNNITSKCESVSQALNSGEVLLCGAWSNSSLNFSQDALVTAYTSCINQNVIKTFTDDTILQRLYQETEQVAKNEAQGLSNIWIYIAIVGVVLLVILIIAAVVFARRS